MVYGIVSSLAGLLKRNLSKPKIDNSVFKLHYRWTTAFCFLCSAFLASTAILGKPIRCVDADKVVTSYCWVASTFTINTTTEKGTYYASHGSNYHGVGTFNPKLHEKTFHAYYQWVPFVLFLQGCLFYLPHQFWETIENNHVSKILQGINVFSNDKNMDTKKQNMIRHLLSSKGLNQKYFFGYFLCECLNMANVVAQLFCLDAFFGGMFMQYGFDILFLEVKDDRSRFDPMIETFPRVTKCEFYQYGPSGTLEKRGYLCVLPQNILNEKIFLIMWVWFGFLLVVTAAQLIFRLGMIISLRIRQKLMEQRGKLPTSVNLNEFVRTLPLGDFFLLYTIGKNVDVFCFKDVIEGLSCEKSAIPHRPTADALYYNEAYQYPPWNSGQKVEI